MEKEQRNGSEGGGAGTVNDSDSDSEGDSSAGSGRVSGQAGAARTGGASHRGLAGLLEKCRSVFSRLLTSKNPERQC